MMRSYLGIVTNHGLQALLQESAYALRFLTRQAYAERPVRSVCYWAAMHAPQATEIQRYLDEGDGVIALKNLQASARFSGPIFPSDVPFSDCPETPSKATRS
jgi:hypothetical protein